MSRQRQASILAADIGGTNSRFALFSGRSADDLLLLRHVTLATGEFTSFSDLLAAGREGLGGDGEDLALASFAVAGPVQKGSFCRPPNIAFTIDISDTRPLGVKRCVLLNDFVAQGMACLTPLVRDALTIQGGRPELGGTVAVVGAGTGLGHCALVPCRDEGYAPQASEAGHMSFPFSGADEARYEAFICKATARPYAIGDQVVSGLGLSLLHEFLTGSRLPASEVAAGLGPDSETLAWFSRFYGRACRNYALAVLALGGVFVSGGVAARNPVLVTSRQFIEEFRLSPTQGELLARMPVKLNAEQDSGLYGAALYGLTARAS